jgi:hypothetical protein
MSSTQTSIGRGQASGGNENHDGDPTTKTLGEKVGQEEPAGAESVTDRAAPELPSGVAGGQPKPGIDKGPKSFPDGPNVEDSPWELDAARGKPHRP